MDKKRCINFHVHSIFPCFAFGSDSGDEFSKEFSKCNSPIAFFSCIAFEGTLASIMTILQIKSIRISKKVCVTLNISTAQRTNKKITKLSLRIILTLCIFVVPQIIISNLLQTVNQFSDNERSVLEFVYCIALSFVYLDSLANAVLFLLTNVKAKRFFRNFVR